MTKAELVEAIAAQANQENDKNGADRMTKKAVGQLVDLVFSTLVTSIKNENRVTIRGFGTWSVRERRARRGHNPHTGETISIKASKTVGFKPAKELRDELS